ncbi:hypothetical protein LINGRAHAP2_LOCUS32217 [Linum grandiflorum]
MSLGRYHDPSGLLSILTSLLFLRPDKQSHETCSVMPMMLLNSVFDEHEDLHDH